MTTPTTGERVLLALSALLAPIRTANGSATEAGADVRMSPMFADLRDEMPWLTLIYISAESYATKPGAAEGIAGNERIYTVRYTALIDVFRRLEERYAARHLEAIKDDVRGAMLPVSGRLLLDGEYVGALRYMGNELIADQLAAGVIGSRARVEVTVKQVITH